MLSALNSIGDPRASSSPFGVLVVDLAGLQRRPLPLRARLPHHQDPFLLGEEGDRVRAIARHHVPLPLQQLLHRRSRGPGRGRPGAVGSPSRRAAAVSTRLAALDPCARRRVVERLGGRARSGRAPASRRRPSRRPAGSVGFWASAGAPQQREHHEPRHGRRRRRA